MSRDLFGDRDDSGTASKDAAPLLSVERGSPGQATARLDQLEVRFGAAADLGKDPEIVFVDAPSGKEMWVRVAKGSKVYRLEVLP